MNKKHFFWLLLVLVSCNVTNLDIYKELNTIASSIQYGFNGFESDYYFLAEVNKEMSIEENIKTISILYQNEMNEKNTSLVLPDNLFFENQENENSIFAYVDFLDAIKFKKIPKNMVRSAIRLFPVFYYENNNSCILLISNFYTKYFEREVNLITVFAQKNDVLIMYRKMIDGRNPMFFQEDEQKIENILKICFQ